MRMPVDDLVSNWAYMVIAALAWNLKAWYGLLTPNKVLGHQIIRMEFKRFINTFIRIPCLIIKTGRRIVYRVVGYNSYMKDFFRTFTAIKTMRFAWLCCNGQWIVLDSRARQEYNKKGVKKYNLQANLQPSNHREKCILFASTLHVSERHVFANCKSACKCDFAV